MLNVIRDEELQKNAAVVGELALTKLKDLMSTHPAIGDVRGKGLMMGVEFVEDRKSRKPDALVAAYVMQRMKSLGVLVSTDGPNRNVVKMKPPLCFNEEDADTLVDAMDIALGELRHKQAESTYSLSNVEAMSGGLSSNEIVELRNRVQAQADRIAILEAKLSDGGL